MTMPVVLPTLLQPVHAGHAAGRLSGSGRLVQASQQGGIVSLRDCQLSAPAYVSTITHEQDDPATRLVKGWSEIGSNWK